LVRDEDPAVAMSVLDQLPRKSRLSGEIIAAGLEHPNAVIRSQAITSASRVIDKDAAWMPALVAAATEEGGSLRDAALLAITRFPGGGDSDALTGLLTSPDPSLRTAVINGLAILERRELIVSAVRVCLDDESDAVVEAAARWLSHRSAEIPVHRLEQ